MYCGGTIALANNRRQHNRLGFGSSECDSVLLLNGPGQLTIESGGRDVSSQKRDGVEAKALRSRMPDAPDFIVDLFRAVQGDDNFIHPVGYGLSTPFQKKSGREQRQFHATRFKETAESFESRVELTAPNRRTVRRVTFSVF